MEVSFVLMLVAVATVSAQGSTCPQVEVKAEFDLSRYLGRWFEIERYPMFFEMGAECVTAQYTLRNDGLVRVFNRMFSNRSQKYQSIEGTAKWADNTGNARLLVSFGPSFPEANYFVVDSDYENYTLVFSCMELGSFAAESAWILSRTPTMSTESRLAVDAAISRNSLNASRFEATRHDENCVYDE